MSSAIASQVSSMAVVLVLIQLSRRIDITVPRNVLIIRMAYGISQLLTLAFLAFLRYKILKINDKSTIEVEEPAKPFSTEAAKKERMTVCEYDLREVSKQIQQTLVSLGLLLVLHSWLGFVQPLILQAILPWKTLLTIPLVRIHMWGSEAKGALARPWKAPNPFGDLIPNPSEADANANDANGTLEPSSVTEFKEEDEKKKTNKPDGESAAKDKKPKRAGGRKED